MKSSSTFSVHHVPLAKNLGNIIRLSCLRICLFFFATAFRHSGTSIVIALLLLMVGISSEPLRLSDLKPSEILFFVSRILSILLSLIWLSLALCRLFLQWIRLETWKQEMKHNEDCLRYRISVLEDWIVLPSLSLSGKRC